MSPARSWLNTWYASGALMAAWLLSGCMASDSRAEDTLPVKEACLVTDTQDIPLVVELATTPEERGKGLMDREHLEQQAGMLFLYDQPRGPNHGFWMYRTLIPLDIAFLDAEGRILAIQKMFPCSSSRQEDCPVYKAGVSFSQALEVNRGFFTEHRVDPGDRLLLEPERCHS